MKIDECDEVKALPRIIKALQDDNAVQGQAYASCWPQTFPEAVNASVVDNNNCMIQQGILNDEDDIRIRRININDEERMH